jgi:plasmid stabilization system protein ParE
MASGTAIIRVSLEAQADFDHIVAFLEESRSVDAAIKFVNAYYAKLDLLETMPGIGRRSSDSLTVRKFRVDKYNMIYYEESATQIDILRVIDSRRDPAQNPFGN